MKLLIVEDDTFVRIIFSLELPEVELSEASSIEEGYGVALSERPDAVVVDRKLPDGDGLQLVRRLRQNFATYRTPIVVLSAGYDPACLEEVVSAGADDYVGKPFSPQELLTHVERLVALPGAELRPRRNGIVDALRSGRPPLLDLTEPEEIDLTDEAEYARPRWRRRRAGMA